MQTLTVSIIQADLSWEDKKANLDMLQKKIESIEGPTEVIVLPEMFSTGFSMAPEHLAETMDGITIGWMQKIAAQKRAILTGSIIIKVDDHYFNRLVWMLPTGDYGYYDKRHLFSYAGEQEHYTAGKKKLISSVKGWKINLQVCYDLRFPLWARQPAEPEKQFDIYINVANWPAKRRHAWKSLLIARAIENQSFVIGVNRVGTDGNGHGYTGDSMVIDPLGEIIYHKEFEEDIFTFTFHKEYLLDIRSHFPFLKDADGYVILDT